MNMKSTLIKNAQLVNENQQYLADLRIKNGRIDK
jgi:dihydroorotase-like cyclic amidohydrolase